MTARVRELCQRLKPVLGDRIDRLWQTYLADPEGRDELEVVLELLARRHLNQSYEPDRSPFPPPDRSFASTGDLTIGDVTYADRSLYPFRLRADRVAEHVLIAGRSGSGKTVLTFTIMDQLIRAGVKVLALDWKRAYRDLRQRHQDLCVYTVGRDVAPLLFNPLIPPPGCEPGVWLKLIVDVIASAYLGGEGVISLLVNGLEKLYTECGAFQGAVDRWPTVRDLLQWLQGTKLRGRAAMWQASAERILIALTHGEFGSILNANSNAAVASLLDRNVVIEMDGLSSASDRVMFSEALALYLYRQRLAEGSRAGLTNAIVLEEAHNLLLAKPSGTRESVLETSIRMIRQYGIGYIFVDQSASMLSRVAFANSYATFALSQKLSADIRALSNAMNLNDDQRDALTTLPVGSAVVRLADEHPEPFLVRIPRLPITDGAVSDEEIRADTHSSGSADDWAATPGHAPVTPISQRDKEQYETGNHPHPPSPVESPSTMTPMGTSTTTPAPDEVMSRDAVRFLTDVAARPLSTTVARYQRLHLSRRKGNAIREDLRTAGLIERVTIPTRSGQVVLHQLTDDGCHIAATAGVDVNVSRRPGIEHQFWVDKTIDHLEGEGYRVEPEFALNTGGIVDLFAERAGKRIAVEIETGKSDIRRNIEKLNAIEIDELIIVATSPTAITACKRVIDDLGQATPIRITLLSWLDVS
jgi:ABC-type dipeptide/oligopeptide/nickel transport system ATPase component